MSNIITPLFVQVCPEYSRRKKTQPDPYKQKHSHTSLNMFRVKRFNSSIQGDIQVSSVIRYISIVSSQRHVHLSER